MLSVTFLLIFSVIVFSFSRRKPRLQWPVIVLFNLLVVEFLAYLYLLFLVSQGGNFFLVGNQVILDKLLKMYHIEAAFGDERSKYSTYRVDNDLGYTLGKNKYYAQFPMSNSQGLRSIREYSLTPPENTLRMAAFGDSFVFCDAELTQNTWTNFLESSSKNLEVLNFGLGGYGLGQSYLRYLKDGLKFKPDIILFNYVMITDRDGFSAKAIIRGRGLREADIYRVRFWIENGVLKTENMKLMDLFDPKFRQAYIYGPFGLKENQGIWSLPIFSISNAGLLIKQAVLQKTLTEKTKDPHVPTVDDIDINAKILENLLATAQKNNSKIFFFVKQDFETLPAKVQDVLNRYKAMVVYVNGQAILDSMFERRGLKREDVMNETGHYNSKGNQIYAQVIAEILVKEFGFIPR